MKKLFTLGLMLIMGITAQAQDKVYIGSANGGGGSKYYIYPSTITKYGDYLKVWQEEHYAKPQIHQKKYYTSSKGQWLIDCNEMKTTPIAVTYYSKGGNVVYSISRSEWEAKQNLEPMAPGSIGWDMIEKTCKYYDRY